MARALKKFDWKKAGRRRYPWDKWLNGASWLLVPGVDFACSIPSLRVSGLTAAKRIGKSLRTTITPDGLVIQAYDRKETQ